MTRPATAPPPSSTPRSTLSSTPSTNELVALGAPIVLRDGSRVRLRQIQDSDEACCGAASND